MSAFSPSQGRFVRVLRQHAGARATVMLAWCVALLFATGSAVAQATVTRIFTKDSSGYAQYLENSADGCSASSVEVFTSDSMTRYNNDSSFLPTIRAQVFTYNYCTGVLTFMSGLEEHPLLSYARDLSHATASGAMLLMDEFGNSHALELSLSWSGGVLSSDKGRTVFTSPRSRTLVKFVGSVRQSESVTGSLVFNGLDLLGPANPNNAFGITGFLTSSKGSTIDVIRY